jgi:ABC-type glycerol-3-phosphate transport system substrate-binding protein
LSFWQPESRPAWDKAFGLVRSDFESSHPNVKVVLTTSDWNTLYPKFEAAYQAGTSPDIYYFDTPSLVIGAANAGQLTPLDDVIAAAKASGNTVPQSALDVVTINGHVRSFPLYSYPSVIWYRKDLFAQAGLQPPDSMESWLADARRFTNPPNMYGTALFNDPDNPRIVSMTIAAFGGKLFDDQGKVAINSPETASAMDFLGQLFKTSTPDAVTKGPSDQRLVFSTGKAAMLLDTASVANNLLDPTSKVKLDQVGAVAMPASKVPGVPTTEALTSELVVATNAKHSGCAKAFLAFWAQPQEMVKFAEDMIVGLTSIWSSVTQPSSPFWTNPRIQAASSDLQVAMGSGASNGYVTGLWPKPNACGPKVVATGLYAQMVSHVVSDQWTGQKTAQWAEQTVKSLCGL